MEAVDAVEAVDELRLWSRLERVDLAGGRNKEVEGGVDERGDVQKLASVSSHSSAAAKEEMDDCEEEDEGEEVEEAEVEDGGDMSVTDGESRAYSANKTAACVILGLVQRPLLHCQLVVRNGHGGRKYGDNESGEWVVVPGCHGVVTEWISVAMWVEHGVRAVCVRGWTR